MNATGTLDGPTGAAVYARAGRHGTRDVPGSKTTAASDALPPRLA
jgi:hypothetical protein